MQNRNVLKLFPQPLIHYKFDDYKEQNIELCSKKIRLTFGNKALKSRILLIDILRF